MPADLIVYALVAAGLVFWLRGVLGTRHGDETQRPNPMAPQQEISIEAMPEKLSVSKNQSETPQERIMALAKNPTDNLSVDNKTAENGLIDISKADENFDINFFLDGAQNAFAMIVEAFAAGDREALKDLLSESIYGIFDKAISDREKRAEIQETRIHDILKAEITEARLQGGKSLITVRFTAEEISVTKDEEGEILSGHPDKISKMHDVWTFGRETISDDPRWLVFETRSDLEEDNDLIPNSD